MARGGYQFVLDEQRRRVRRITERRAAAQLKKLYEKALADLERKISRIARAGAEFDPMINSLVKAQLKQGIAQLTKQLAGELGDIGAETQREALRGLTSDLHKLNRRFGATDVVIPIDEASVFQGILDKRKKTLLRVYKSSMNRYGQQIISKVEDQLALALVQKESVGDVASRVASTIQGEWWRGERIARTETAMAYATTATDGMKETAKDLPDLHVRWSENVSDSGYQPLDARVGLDSIAMHGQVAKPGERFVMPPTTPGGEPVPKSLIGLQWEHPPNRPNDRAVATPWRPGWGVLGWKWKGGRRVRLDRGR